MEIYQLKAFVTAARLGSVTRTAEMLHLTQPAITAQIKALEEELGVALFERRLGRISLTKSGELLLVDAQQVLTCAARLVGQARQLQGQLTGALILGTVADTEVFRLGTFLSALLKVLPLLDIKTKSDHAEGLREKVAAGAINGAFYIGPSIPQDVAGMALKTLTYRIVGPVALSDPLLRADWESMAALPWIVAPAHHHLRILTHELFSRQGLLPNVVLESDEASEPLSLIKLGLGLALMREDVALLASEKNELVIWPHARIVGMLSFIHPKISEHDPVMVATLSVLRQIWGIDAPTV